MGSGERKCLSITEVLCITAIFNLENDTLKFSVKYSVSRPLPLCKVAYALADCTIIFFFLMLHFKFFLGKVPYIIGLLNPCSKPFSFGCSQNQAGFSELVACVLHPELPRQI